MASTADSRPGWPAAEQDAELAAIFAQTAAGLAQVDLTGRFTLVNDRFCEMVGRSRSELLAITMQSITHPDHLADNVPLFEAAVRDGTPYRIEKRYLRPDGSIIWVDNSVSVIRKPDGSPFGVLAASIDITHSKAVEEALRASELRLRLAMDAGRMAVWEYDIRAGRIHHSSDLNRLLGFVETRDVAYDEFRARIDPDDLDRLSRTAVASLKAGEPHFQAEVRYRLSRGEVRWLLVSAEFQRSSGRAVDRVIGVALDITDRKRDEEHQRLLLHELNHRVKNTLAVVQALAHQSFAGSRDRARREAFEGRLAALAAAHNLLTRESWEPASIIEVIRSAAAACDPNRRRLQLRGPDIRVPPKMAVTLALAVHELCTNAVKYGALSNDSGQVAISWKIDDGRLRLVWTETGGPRVAPPRRRGFGSMMLERALASELVGSVKLDFAPAGLCCTIDAPVAKDWFIGS
ncbi:PAS domain S-box protein [Sphingomonas sp. MAH-20]|uniref:histidine kinase n=1 Tax=Sphingomonas horti TaxID=2682842 RepID=A0A6I4J394_9SPHN|nr:MULTISPECIES: sensor histidine kinase [Sphingomonas]MBA2919159.1 PAS domain S-box protein [Sphingomonas sp. CGMCC 1.13658]MVO79192.1 PAS domain S-box protein [Sphingomonas horti]